MQKSIRAVGGGRTAALRAQILRSAIPAVLAVAVVCLAPWAARQTFPPPKYPSDLRSYAAFYLILHLAPLFVFLAAYALAPAAELACHRLRLRWRFGYTIGAVAGASAFFTAFILYFGNRQFGGYDFSILIDTGWRLASGQMPYRDFVCTPPPGFYLGLKYAFACFGINWNAQLWATAIFSCGTFLWIFWLLSAVVRTRLAAFFVALAIECAAILTLDFWWYNNVTAISGTVFFLSCLAYIERRGDAKSSISYTCSLALLGLMKPNTAGLLATGAIVLLLIAVPRRLRLAALTLTAIAGAIGFLILNGISIEGMIVSYLNAAAGRGKPSLFGFRNYGFGALFRIAVSVLALATPMWLLISRFRAALRKGDLRALAYGLLFALAFLVSVFAMFTNGELKDVEWAILIASGAAILFRSSPPVALRRFCVAFLLSLMFTDLYMGAVRYRVYGIGPHEYFEWTDSDQHIPQLFFRDLTASTRFKEVVEQVGQTLKTNPGPFFFGPRMEFSYAAFGLPSPLHLPPWWDPGTSFAYAHESELLSAWHADDFATLIFLKNDFTYYSPRFLRLINRYYVRDDSRSQLTVFHTRGLRRVPAD